MNPKLDKSNQSSLSDWIIPSAIWISAYFERCFHCIVKSANRFRICDTISPIYSCTGRMLRIDRKWFGYHNEIHEPANSTVQLDAREVTGSHFGQFQQPMKERNRCKN